MTAPCTLRRTTGRTRTAGRFASALSAGVAAALLCAMFAPAGAARVLSAEGEQRVIKIRSGDVATLVAATASPEYAGTVIVLEAGVDPLTGPLRLQRNQFLRGTNRYRFSGGVPAPRPDGGYADGASETVLDCTQVAGQGCVFITQGGLTGLSVFGGAIGALVQVGGAGTTAPYDVHLRRVDLRGGLRGFRMQVSAGHGSALVEQSVMRDTSGFFSFGWQLQTGAGASVASIDATITHSTIAGNNYGGFVAGLGSGASLDVTSHANAYVGNGGGLVLNPGRDATAALGGTSPGANGNRLTFISESDAFFGNGVSATENSAWPHLGGITAATALRTGPGSAPHSNNTMVLTVKDPTFFANAVADLLAYAALSLDGNFPHGLPSTESAGHNNVLDLTLDVGAHTGSFVGCDSMPADATNQLLVHGGTLMEDCGPLS